MKTCEYRNCSNVFKERGLKRFCSRKCKQYNKHVNCEKRKLTKKIKKRPYIVYRKNYCENCKFVALHKCQLDVDHIDGNHKNNDPSNLQTLCANCHRLKTYLNKDWIP